MSTYLLFFAAGVVPGKSVGDGGAWDRWGPATATVMPLWGPAWCQPTVAVAVGVFKEEGMGDGREIVEALPLLSYCCDTTFGTQRRVGQP